MKQFFTIGFIIFSLIKLNSQDFAPIGATWYYTEGYASSSDIGYFKLTSVKDTIIKGINCKVIEKNKTQGCSNRPSIEYMYKNDSGEVYFYDAHFNKFQKIWDFEAEINDTWEILLYLNEEYIDTLTYRVDSISKISINNKDLKVFHVSYDFNGGVFEYFFISSKIIEGIGDMSYFFPWNVGFCDENYAEGLRCYNDSELGFYSTGIVDSCDYTYKWTGIEDNKPYYNFDIYPNPTSGHINIITEPVKNYIAEIHDLNGRKLLSINLKSINQINISDFKTGLYFLVIKENEKIIDRKRIIKD